MSLHSIPPLVALVDASGHMFSADTSRIAAALQKQVVRDFAPIWGVTATVAAFPTQEDVPHGYWQIVVKDKLDDPGAAGYHTDEHGQPLALVEWGGSVEETCMTCSHELLEMLADPWGSRLVVCTVPESNATVRARVLVEVRDPCEAYSYEVDGLPVSDFATPHYYGPSHHWSKKVKPGGPALSFLDVIERPLTVQRGGYLSYVVPDGSWWQTTWFGGSSPAYRNIGAALADLEEPQGSLRAAIDRVTTSEAQHFIVPGNPTPPYELD
jgi:hypothetical protein